MYLVCIYKDIETSITYFNKIESYCSPDSPVCYLHNQIVSHSGYLTLQVWRVKKNMHILTINLFFFFFQLESLVQDMQDKVHGVPVRHQKVFLTSIPFAFMGKFFLANNNKQQKKRCICRLRETTRVGHSDLFFRNSFKKLQVSGVKMEKIEIIYLFGIKKFC